MTFFYSNATVKLSDVRTSRLMENSKRRLSLNSRACGTVPGHKDRMRFVLDCPLTNVVRIEIESLEMQTSDTYTTDERYQLFFSEDHGDCVVTFSARIPPGQYDDHTIWRALEASMVCASPVYPPDHAGGPLNRYGIEVLPVSKRILVTSTGRLPFQLHTTRGELRDVRLVQRDSTTAFMQFRHSTPNALVRGAVVQVFHPNRAAALAQVTDRVGDFVVTIAYELAAEEVKGWSAIPLSASACLTEMMGLGTRDLRGGTAVQTIAFSSPASGPSRPPDRRLMQVALAGPHGCHKGDAVRLEASPDVFIDDIVAIVEDVESESHLTLSVDCTPLGAFGGGRWYCD